MLNKKIFTIFLASCLLLLVAGSAMAQAPTIDDLKDAVPDSFWQKMKNFFKFIWNSFLALLKGAGEIFGLIFEVASDALHRMLELPPFQDAYQ